MSGGRGKKYDGIGKKKNSGASEKASPCKTGGYNTQIGTQAAIGPRIASGRAITQPAVLPLQNGWL